MMTSPADSRNSFQYLLKESILFLFFTYFLLFANTWRAYADYTLIRNGVILLAGASSLWLLFALLHRWKAPTPLSLSLLLFLAVYTLTAFTSIQPTRSFDEVWTFAMYTFCFALVAQLAANGWPPEMFIKALLIAGSILMGISLYLTLNWYQAWLAASGGKLIPDIAYRLPLANGQATYLYLMLFAVITRWRVTRARLPRIFLVVWAVPALILLFLTASRGGWLATSLGLFIIIVVYVRDAGGFNALRNLWGFIRQRWLLSLTLGVIGVVVLAGLVWVASQQLINPQKGPAVLARVEFWVPAWQAFWQRPLLGQGPLTYGSAYLRYNSVPPYGFFAHAHNTILNLLVESGLIGVLAFSVLVFSTFVAVWKQVCMLTGENRAVAIAALAGAAAWAAHSLVDTVQVEPMNSLVILVILGAALGKRDVIASIRPVSKSKLFIDGGRIGWPIVLGLVLSVTGFYNVWKLAPYTAGVTATVSSNWPEAQTQFAEAVRRESGSVMAHQQLGLTDSILADKNGPDNLEQAISEFEIVVRLDPDWWLNHANLAALYMAQGDSQAALAESRLASQLGSMSPLTQLNYGVVAESAGQFNEARQAYQTTLTLRPDWAEAYFWRATKFRIGIVSDWRNLTPASLPLTLTQMEQQAKGGDEVGNYTPLAAEYLRLGRVAEAETLLRRADLAFAVTGESEIEVVWLKAEAAAIHKDWASAISLGQRAIDGYQAQSAFGPGAFGQAAYGQVFFRRDTMAVDLVPQLPEVPLTDKWADRWVSLGDWQANSGDVQAARDTYMRLLKLVPDNQLARDRLR
jgi:O-antigen ligase/tetratricopeptide (TPR) repeat protein